MPQPKDDERSAAVNWVRTNLKNYAEKNAGDPGGVTVRRLTSAEYGYTIHDMTGHNVAAPRTAYGCGPLICRAA